MAHPPFSHPFRGRPGDEGFTVLEVLVAASVLAVIALAGAGLLRVSLRLVGDLSADASLWTRHRLALARAVAEVEGADSTDSKFAVSAASLRFRLVTGATGTGTRTYGATVTYTIEGPVIATGGQSAYRLVRTERDTTDTTLVGRTVILSDLTSTTDADAPSAFSYAAPYVTLKLVARVPSPATKGGRLVAGISERVKLRY